MTPTERLIRVRDWLRQGAPPIPCCNVEAFSMAAGIESNSPSWDGTLPDCGTTCCIAGAVVAFNQANTYLPDFPWSDVSRRAHAPIVERELHELFAEHLQVDGIPPHHAADVIDHYIDTHTVDWRIRQ